MEAILFSAHSPQQAEAEAVEGHPITPDLLVVLAEVGPMRVQAEQALLDKAFLADHHRLPILEVAAEGHLLSGKLRRGSVHQPWAGMVETELIIVPISVAALAKMAFSPAEAEAERLAPGRLPVMGAQVVEAMVLEELPGTLLEIPVPRIPAEAEAGQKELAALAALVARELFWCGTKKSMAL